MRAALLGLAVLAPLLAVPAVAQKRSTPYFASIRASEARMRTGPGRNFPASWLYRRADLPVRVLDRHDTRRESWVKIEDPGGTQGWMMRSLVSDQRTGFVLGTVAELREAPRFGARIVWRAAPGVVGRISKCMRGWCLFDVRGRSGYVEVNRLWGVDRDEVVD